jgi:ribosomal protein S18 acetylase RimI-like enzyme
MTRTGHSTVATLRLATLDDVDALLAIEMKVFATDRISRRSFRRYMTSPTCEVIAAAASGGTAGERVVGYALVAFRRNSKRARIYSLANAASDEIRGVGRLLLGACEDRARLRGATSIHLEVDENNLRAIGLYEAIGYVRIGRREDYYESGAAALLYEKPL